MEKQTMSFSVPAAKLTPVQPENSGFTLTKVWVCSPGKNRNFSNISKEELDLATPSLKYIPVVGHLYEKYDKDGNMVGRLFGGHDVELTENWELRDITVPFGVVTVDAPSYEMVTEFGKEKEYMTAYAMLWTGRYPEILEATYSDDVWYNQSMEINYQNWTVLEEDSNYVDLHGLEFSALCILGKSDDPTENVEPCFPSARIEPVKFDLNGAQFNQLMAEMREQLSLCFEANTTKEGGNESLNHEMIEAIFAELGIAMDAINFEITEDMTEEQLRAALEAFAAEQTGAGDEPVDEPADDPVDNPVDEPADEPTDEPADDPAPPAEDGGSEFSAKFATVNQKREALRNALDPVVIKDGTGKIVSEMYYYVSDFDDNYVFVERDIWTVDNYECKYGRMTYTFDESTMTASITSEFEEMVKMWLTLAEAAALNAERAELETLRQFKLDTEDAQHTAAMEAVMAEFEDVSGLEEYSAICESATDAEDLEMRLFALRGKQVKIKKTPKSETTVKVGIQENQTGEEEPYGGLFAKYGYTAKK